MLTVMREGAGLSEPAGETFTGTTWKDVHMPPTDGVGVGNVFFEPCSRTHWHSHGEGQLLIIVAGEGIVATEKEAVRVRAGDKVWTPPGVRHWHGATSRQFMIHTAVTLGEVTWEDAVGDQQYAALA
jgi:quercetin dioxygenase-like cupin family protein